MNHSIKCILILVMITGVSCKKFVEVPAPPNQLITASVFEDDNTATSALSGIYSRMIELPGGCIGQLATNLGLSSDELLGYFASDPSQGQMYQNALTPNNSRVESVWGNGYDGFFTFIYAANTAIEGLNASTALSAPIKSRLLGEAKFVRAFSLFYLVNLFGDVPLPLTSDYVTNSKLSRAPVAQVYEQIVADLQEAQTLLPADFAATDGERIRPMQWAATALLARVYLYNQQWAEAEQQATAVISNTGLFQLESDLNNVFLTNSMEAIWQLKPVSPGFNSWDGWNFVLVTNPDNVSLDPRFVSELDSADGRKANWIGSLDVNDVTYYYANKYKNKEGSDVTEYNMMFRLAEQYLLRAEARAHQNNIDGAKEDLDVIRSRAGLTPTSANVQPSMLSAIAEERKYELFCEMGHRWLDLKRTNTADAVLGLKKPDWKPTAILMPVPRAELLNDPNLTQNPGY